MNLHADPVADGFGLAGDQLGALLRNAAVSARAAHSANTRRRYVALARAHLAMRRQKAARDAHRLGQQRVLVGALHARRPGAHRSAREARARLAHDAALNAGALGRTDSATAGD